LEQVELINFGCNFIWKWEQVDISIVQDARQSSQQQQESKVFKIEG
jgi:hypothetical protein